jgi:hypothetical protein
MIYGINKDWFNKKIDCKTIQIKQKKSQQMLALSIYFELIIYYPFNASAPPTISKISLVIEA